MLTLIVTADTKYSQTDHTGSPAHHYGTLGGWESDPLGSHLASKLEWPGKNILSWAVLIQTEAKQALKKFPQDLQI